jgi:hypothetical protein
VILSPRQSAKPKARGQTILPRDKKIRANTITPSLKESKKLNNLEENPKL